MKIGKKEKKLHQYEKNEIFWAGMGVNILNRKLSVVIAKVTFEQNYERVREFVKNY